MAVWSGYSSPDYNAKSRLVLALPALVVALGLLVLATARLQVRLAADGVHYRYPPLLRWRHQPWAALKQVYPRRYAPFGDYGGWGLRGLGHNKSYTVWGRDGLQLVMPDGTLILLGTQRPQQLREALKGLKAALPTLPIRLPAAA